MKMFNIIIYVKRRKEIIGKFFFVSGSAVLINLLLLFLLVNYLGFESNWEQNAANAISMELSIIYNFLLSRSITWKDRRQESGGKLLFQIVKFHITIGITVAFRLGLFALLQMLGVQYIINAAIGVAISALFNFVIYDALIFKKKEG
jgi:dolichol-phosphate mannosyltransferase